MSKQRFSCWLFLVLVAQGFWCPRGQCAAEKLSQRCSLQVGEFKRAYRLYVPPTYDGSTPWPLVLVFHGRFQNTRDVERMADFTTEADRQRFLIAYPIGIHGHWNDGRKVMPIGGARNYDDVGFVKALLAHLTATMTVDPNRIYATGMSNGGMFVQRLACELSGTFAAIGPVSGTLPSDIAPRCAPQEPVSVIEFHGTKDAYTHWQGGTIRALGGRTLSVPQTISHWRRVNGCSGQAQIAYLAHHDPEEDATKVRWERSSPCHGGSEVVLYSVEGGGHTWPGGEEDHSLPFLGRVTHDVSASQTILDFFVQHPKSTQDSMAPLPLPQTPTDRHQAPTPPLVPLPVLSRLLSSPFTLASEWIGAVLSLGGVSEADEIP